MPQTRPFSKNPMSEPLKSPKIRGICEKHCPLVCTKPNISKVMDQVHKINSKMYFSQTLRKSWLHFQIPIYPLIWKNQCSKLIFWLEKFIYGSYHSFHKITFVSFAPFLLQKSQNSIYRVFGYYPIRHYR